PEVAPGHPPIGSPRPAPPEKIAPYKPFGLSWGRFRGSWASPSSFHTAWTHSRHVASLPRVCAHRNIPGGGTPGVEDLLCAGQSRHNAALSDTRRIGFFAD